MLGVQNESFPATVSVFLDQYVLRMPVPAHSWGITISRELWVNANVERVANVEVFDFRSLTTNTTECVVCVGAGRWYNTFVEQVIGIFTCLYCDVIPGRKGRKGFRVLACVYCVCRFLSAFSLCFLCTVRIAFAVAWVSYSQLFPARKRYDNDDLGC